MPNEYVTRPRQRFLDTQVGSSVHYLSDKESGELMNEADKRIAVEVMVEPEPEVPEWVAMDTYPYLKLADSSTCENWELLRYGNGDPAWSPLPFSSDLDQAMRAVDKYLDQGERSEDLVLELTYDKYLTDGRWSVCFEEMDAESPHRDMFGDGDTHAEAICNLLLALVDDD